jgi:ribosome-binding factor A
MHSKKHIRLERVGDLIHKEVAMLILQHTGDERFRKVTVTGVEMNRDLSYAKVYVTVLLDDATEIRSVVKALNNASKYFRHRLGEAVQLRILPELKFIFDEATVKGFRLSDLIDAAAEKSKLGKE